MNRPKHVHFLAELPLQTSQTIHDLIEREQFAQAEQMLAKLNVKQGGQHKNLIWYGRALEQAGHHNEAIKIYRHITQTQPDHAHVWTLLGDCYHQQRQFTQARNSYKKALENASYPLDAIIYIKIASLTILEPDETKISTLQRYADSPKHSVIDRANALATIGKIWLDCQNDAVAFDYFEQANTLIKKTLHPANSLKPKLHNLRHSFTAGAFEALSPFGIQHCHQIFIVGFSRSGKSLVESLLKGATNITANGETTILESYTQKILSQFNYDFDHFLAAQTPDSINKNAQGYLEALKPGADLHVSTIPSDIWNLGFIGLWLPKSPIIFCSRELLDLGATVYFRQYKEAEPNHYSFDQTVLGEHIALYEKMIAHWAKVLPNPLFLVDYETLVNNPEQIMNQLFLNLDLEQEQHYSKTVVENSEMISEIGPLISLDVPMPFTNRFIGLGDRFRERLEPMVKSYQSTYQEMTQDEEQLQHIAQLPASLQIRDTETDAPPTEADFSWLLPHVITVVDNNAHLLRQGKAQALLDCGACTLICLDPAGEFAPVAQDLNSPSLLYIAQALLGKGQATSLHLSLDAAYNSTLTPLDENRRPAHLAQKSITLAQLPVTTYALDTIEGLERLDYLILDGLHDHITILGHGPQRLSNALLIQVCIAMPSTHQGQTSLAALLHWAKQHGYRLLRLVDEQFEQHMPVRQDLALQPMGHQLTKTSVLLVPSYQRQATLSPAQRLKLAFLLDTVHNIHDFSYELLLQSDPSLAERYLKARGYKERKRNGPDLQEIRHIRQLLHTGDLPIPQHQTRNWIEQYPTDPLAQSLYAECLSWSGQHRLAILTIQEAIAKSPKELVLRQTAVEIMSRAGMWWETIAPARALYARYPERTDIQQLWWNVLSEQANPEAQELEDALSGSQGAPEGLQATDLIKHHATRGRLLAHKQQWQQAWDHHDQAIHLAQGHQGPERAQALIAKADSLYQAGQVDESCEHLWQACTTYRYSPYTAHAYRKLNARLSESTRPDLQRIAALHQKIEQIWAGCTQDSRQHAFGEFDLPHQGFEPLKLAGSRPAMLRLETYGLQALLPAAASALDISCNHGFLLIGLAPHLSQGLGLDISQRCIDVGKAVAEHLGHKHIKLNKQPFTTFKSKQHFDLIIACAGHHWSDIPPLEFGSKLFNLCKPAGFVLLENGSSLDTQLTEGDVETKASSIVQFGFTVIRKGSLCEDGINNREFWVLQRK